MLKLNRKIIYFIIKDNKSPHLRDGHERSHDKFDRERGNRDERNKSTRSRLGY